MSEFLHLDVTRPENPWKARIHDVIQVPGSQKALQCLPNLQHLFGIQPVPYELVVHLEGTRPNLNACRFDTFETETETGAQDNALSLGSKGCMELQKLRLPRNLSVYFTKKSVSSFPWHRIENQLRRRQSLATFFASVALQRPTTV